MRPVMPSAPAPAGANPAQAAPTIPHPVRSSPLPAVGSARKSTSKPSIGLLVGVAAAFLVVGALLAALIMKLVMK